MGTAIVRETGIGIKSPDFSLSINQSYSDVIDIPIGRVKTSGKWLSIDKPQK